MDAQTNMSETQIFFVLNPSSLKSPRFLPDPDHTTFCQKNSLCAIHHKQFSHLPGIVEPIHLPCSLIPHHPEPFPHMFQL